MLIRPSDPVQWMTPLVGPVIGLAMLLVLIFANLSSLIGMLQGNVPKIVQNFGPLARMMGFAGNVAMLGVAAALILLMASDALYARFYTVMALYGAIFAATVGILLADWLVLRRGTVDVRALHHPVPGSAYAGTAVLVVTGRSTTPLGRSEMSQTQPFGEAGKLVRFQAIAWRAAITGMGRKAATRGPVVLH